jgi:hypothetical protein
VTKSVEPSAHPPARPGAVHPLVVFVLAVSCGAAAAALSDWHTAFAVFAGVLAFFTAGRRGQR